MKVHFVRGPCTAQTSPFRGSEFIADPAYCLALLGYKTANPSANAPVGFVPHYHTLPSADWQRVCDELGFVLISPEAGVERVLELISQCKLILSEAMHGAIAADCLRIPWIPISLRTRLSEGSVGAWKWADWLGAMELSLNRVKVPFPFPEDSATTNFQRIKRGFKLSVCKHWLAAVARREPFLSKDVVWKEKIDRLDEKIETLNRAML
ncbi:polysaccharide pyruvyl transferase family protein [Roseiconus nitratireducens]|uniref:polysaccharide pyruvyl transferase family protein n=1 Tax=Roseiconus nitratireducens TaxID=2605748 RepID=UPI0013761286|nr:polysaccharide pyruvyl transferase family protein [Roseiconus nitratireducens]